MTLPRIDKPTFEMKVPSMKTTVVFRPFLVKEEKILLIAYQSNDDRDIVRALTQIIGACVQTAGFNVSRLTTFDLEYMFLKLRAKSVNNVVTLQYQDNEDDQIYKFDVNLDDVEITEDPNHTNKIQITDDIGIIMKYPSVSLADELSTEASPIDIMNQMILACIDKIYDSENVYETKDYTSEELNDFIDNLDVNTYDKIRTFFETMPKMEYIIEYKNSNGTDRRIELSSLRDFFTWG